MEVRQIRPIHLFRDYKDFYDALEGAKGDVMMWQFVKDEVKNFDVYCQFLNDHEIENWVFDDGNEFYVRLRFSHFKQAAMEVGIAHEGSFRLR